MLIILTHSCSLKLQHLEQHLISNDFQNESNTRRVTISSSGNYAISNQTTKLLSNDSGKFLASSVDATQEVKMAEPYKPDDEERDESYHGIAGKSRPVARTSHERWTRPRNGASELRICPKRFVPIHNSEQQELVSKWTMPRCKLRSKEKTIVARGALSYLAPGDTICTGIPLCLSER
ncbi:hypothetical protein F4806DRAFT_452461 [Annulohypoxylon nitens]|nr:hypothetical protein F4806DRAFT_452461 [Annulohypoxylon nitens]